jgi:hypothetical protein
VTTLYLRNRMSVRGRIVTFDPYVILLEPLEGGPPHLVYKSAVVSISGPRLPPPSGGRGGARPPQGSRGPRPPRPEGAGPGAPERSWRPPTPAPADGPPSDG